MRKVLFYLICFAFVLGICTPVAYAGLPTVSSIAGFNRDDYNGGVITVTATVIDALPFTAVYFEYYTTSNGTWTSLGFDDDGTDGYSLKWDTGLLVDLNAGLRAYADTAGSVTPTVEETFAIVNIIPDSITGFSDPDEGDIVLTAAVLGLDDYDYPEQVQFGYSLDGGETIVGFSTGANAGLNWNVTLNSASIAGGLASREFVVAARCHNGAVWCSWAKSDSFLLTNNVNVQISTTLGSSSEVTVDGETTNGTFQSSWKYFQDHEVSVPEYMLANGSSRRAFSHWSNGGSREQTFSVEESSDANLTATYIVEYFMTLNSSQTYLIGDGEGYYASGQQINIVAEDYHSIDNYNRYHCTGWTSPQLGTSSDAELMFTINRAVQVTFNWELEYLFEVFNDLYSSTGATQGWYVKNTVLVGSVPQYVEATNGVRYACLGYEGSGALTYAETNSTGSFEISMPTSINWFWATQYYLEVETPVGSGVGAGWYNDEEIVDISIIDDSDPKWYRHTFLGWSGTGAGSVTTNDGVLEATVIINGPITQYANYTIEYYLGLETIGELGGFVEDLSGWYESGTIVTVTLSEPDETDVIRYLPEWRGQGEGSFSFTMDYENPRQVVITMNNPIYEEVEWFVQYGIEILNPSGFGIPVPAVGFYWLNPGDEFNATTTGSDGDYFCSGFTGTGDFETSDATNATITVSQPSAIQWNWIEKPEPIVQYWHPGEAVSAEINSRVFDAMMIGAIPLAVYYDDSDDTIKFTYKFPTETEWVSESLMAGLGEVTHISISTFEDLILYIAVTTAKEEVYLISYTNGYATPTLLETNVGDGTHAIVVVTNDGVPYVYYRDGVYGDLMQRLYNKTTDLWEETLVDTNISRYDLAASLNPDTNLPALAYRKGLYLYTAVLSTEGWKIVQVTEEGNAGHDLSIVCDDSGSLFVSYADYSNFRGNQLYTSIGGNEIWDTEVVDATYGSGNGSSVRLDEYARPQIAHRAETSISFARFDGAIWETATIAEGGTFEGMTRVLVKADNRCACFYFIDGVLTYGEAKATEPTDNGTGIGGDDPNDDPNDEEEDGGNGGGGCFIATAAFGSLSAKAVSSLTSIRDTNIAASSMGSDLVSIYYAVSPAPANELRNSESLRALIRRILQ